MELNFEKYNYELFQDWQENPVKTSFTSALKKSAEEEKRVFQSLVRFLKEKRPLTQVEGGFFRSIFFATI